MTERLFLSFSSRLSCLKVTETTDTDTLCSSSPASWTTGRREVPQTPALRKCPTDAVLSSRCQLYHLDCPNVRLSRSTKNFMKKYNLELTAATFLILDSNEASMEVSCVRPGQATGLNLFTSRLPASGRNVSGTPSTWSVLCSAASQQPRHQNFSAILHLKCGCCYQR